MLFSVFLGFLLGALAIILAEVLGFLFILNRLSSKYSKKQTLASQLPNPDLDPHQSLSFAYNKQGVLWVLEPEKVPKLLSGDKLPKEKKSKKEILEVFPVKKRAKIKDHSLILTDSDGSQATIDLVGCTIVSVSASNLSSRKWAKRYPVKVEGRNSVIYKGSRTFYIYLETSWEKESWCKSLRLASSDDKKREIWYAILKKEFHNYITTLNAGNPSLKKSTIGSFGEVIDRTSNGSSSRVRQFLKKLTKKTAKNGTENKGIGTSTSAREERKMGEKSRLHDMSVTGSIKPSTEGSSHNLLDEDNVLPLPSNLSHSGSQHRDALIYDANFNDKLGIDEGTLCCNLLISRLFFDAKRNTEMKSSIQARIQRTLSNIRTPSYIGGITCTGLDLGTLPPYIHSMRVLPMDMSEVWTMELDIEYSGGVLLDIETRLEVREPDLQKRIVNTSLESSSMEHMTSELLEDFEILGNQLNLSEGIDGDIEKKQEGDNKHEGVTISKCSSWKSAYASRWNSILNSIAKQVSQVPISLTIRISSVRGTLRLHIKPPPSDQLWITFTSMPDIDFNVDSSVGDHKVTSGYVAVILANRFKAAIRDTLVLPNCESVCIPWMLADKDDWVPRKAAPFIWVNQQVVSEPITSEVPSYQNEEAETKLEAAELPPKNHLEDNHDKAKNSVCIQVPTLEQSEESTSSINPSLSASSSTSQSSIQPSLSASSSTSQSNPNPNPNPNHTHSLQDLKIPLLFDDSKSNNSRSESPERHSTSEAVRRERSFPASEDGSPKKTGRRARMMDLGKKMSEKLEEKRRHIEEKSRTIVEKMRGPP